MLEGIEHLLDFSAVLLWAAGICQERFTGNRKRWAAGGALLAGLLIASAYCRNGIETLLVNYLSVIVYMLLIEEEWKKKIAVCLFSNYYLRIFYEPLKLLAKAYTEHFGGTRSEMELLVSSGVILCVVICFYWIRRHSAWRKWIKEEVSARHYFIGFVCAFMAMGLTSYIEIEAAESNRRTRIFVLCLTITVDACFYAMGIVIAVIHSLYEHYKAENVLKDEYLRLSKKHYESLSAGIREVRGLRHDMRAHLNAVKRLTEEEDVKRLAEYLESVEEASEGSGGYFVDVNHELVNAVLTDAFAGEKGTKLSYEGAIPEGAGVDDFDLCTIFSNLASNSIEACRKLGEGRREVRLEIRSFRGSLYIRMENPSEGEVDVKKLGGWTSKKDREQHGYGIKNIQSAVEKYEGDLTIRNEEGKFSVEIVFWDVIK